VKEWTAGASQISIGVPVPERRQVQEVEGYLNANGISAAAIGSDGPCRPDGVHVGTLHRFKGLEYQRMILVVITDWAIPSQHVTDYQAGDPLQYGREIMRARSLLFVTAIRARDSLMMSWHGQSSRFLPPV
jgi:superfamily I DNA/RNA helicase